MAGGGSRRSASTTTTAAATSSSRPRYAPEDPTLPKPWRALVDGSTGYLYYWNPETTVTQYERPEPDLPPPPPLLPPPPPRPPPPSSKSLSSQVSDAAHDRKRDRDRDHRRRLNEDYDDDRDARSRNSHHHQHADVRGSSTQGEGHSTRDLRDTKLSSSWGQGLSSAVGGASSAEAYRRQHEIFVTGDNVPAPYMTFESADFPPEILKEVHHAGFSLPTPIQAQAWPIALQTRDIVAVAKTGSGKTLGYLIPGFIHLKHLRNNSKVGPTVLVLAPTRELATQIQDEAVKFGRSSRISCTCLYGGAPKGPQLRDLERGVDIVVATPGRLNDMLEMRRVSLRQVSYLVLDEADRMLDMGFEPQIRKIVKDIPHHRQTLMFTATWPKEVRKIAADLLVHPVQVNIGSTDELVANKAITQHVEVITPGEKLRRLEQILRSQDPGSKVIVFCSTKRMCDQLSRTLARQFGAAAIHGDKSQSERDRVLSQFRSGRSPILVATDVAARGLDIKDIRVVINYDFPTGVEDYVHRIGRTGRAGATGVSYTFFCQQDKKYAADLVKILEGANQRVPRELRDLVLRGGFGGRSRRWASHINVRDGGRSRIGRNDSNMVAATSSRPDSRLGVHGANDYEVSRDRYGRGYDDGHKVDAHERTSRGRGRSRSRSHSYSHSKRRSPSLRTDHGRPVNSRSRSRSRSWSRSRSRSRSIGRGLDYETAPQEMEHVEQPLSRRSQSPPNHDNTAGSCYSPTSYYEEKTAQPGDDSKRIEVQLYHSPNAQNEKMGLPHSTMDEGTLQEPGSPAQWRESASLTNGTKHYIVQPSIASPSLPDRRSCDDEEEGMIAADDDGGMIPPEEGGSPPQDGTS